MSVNPIVEIVASTVYYNGGKVAYRLVFIDGPNKYLVLADGLDHGQAIILRDTYNLIVGNASKNRKISNKANIAGSSAL
jgi:ribosomal protein L2